MLEMPETIISAPPHNFSFPEWHIAQTFAWACVEVTNGELQKDTEKIEKATSVVLAISGLWPGVVEKWNTYITTSQT